MTQLEREKSNEKKREVKGQTMLHIVEIGRVPHNKSYFCVRETRNGYYLQSFDTIVLYVSKKDGRLTRSWDHYTRATTTHINKALEWIRTNTQTVPEKRRLSGESYANLPMLNALGKLYEVV